MKGLLTRHARGLCPLLFWGLAACAATSAPTRPGEGAAAPAAPASQASAVAPAASDPASSASAVASASARPPAQARRLTPASREQLVGTCTLGAPVTIGKSTTSDASRPDVAIAASTEGVVASWMSRDDQVTTIALDASGRTKGEGRSMASSTRSSQLLLWELGDGTFVQAFVLPKPTMSTPGAPQMALQRVNASGELVGDKVPFSFDTIRAVAPFKDQLVMLTSDLGKREIVRVSATPGGLATKQTALPKYPGDIPIREWLVPTSSGAAWVISEEMHNAAFIEREGGESVKVKMPSAFWGPPVASEDDELLWPVCSGTAPGRGLRLQAGKLVEAETPGGACDGPSFAAWNVGPSPNVHAVNNRGLGVLFPPESGSLLFTLSTRTERQLTWSKRGAWFNQSTWTGTSVLTVYVTGKRGDWTIVAQPITCAGGAPSSAASASAPATGVSGTKN